MKTAIALLLAATYTSAAYVNTGRCDYEAGSGEPPAIGQIRLGQNQPLEGLSTETDMIALWGNLAGMTDFEMVVVDTDGEGCDGTELYTFPRSFTTNSDGVGGLKETIPSFCLNCSDNQIIVGKYFKIKTSGVDTACCRVTLD